MDKKEERKQYLKNKIDQLNAKQLCIKIFINSVYGYFGNKQAPIGDDDIASSITLTGQSIIKEASNIAEQYVYSQTGQPVKDITVLSDTDSVVGSTELHTSIGTLPIEELYNMHINNSTCVSSYGHDIINVDKNKLKTLTFDSTNNKVVFGKIKNLIRHKVSKKQYRIKCGNKQINMTEDHGCMVLRNNVLMRVSPKDIIAGDKFIVLG